MPLKPPYPCGYPGCPELIRDGRFCDRHAKVVRASYDRNRGNSSKRGYGGHWRIIRAMYLKRHPLCEDIYGVHAAAHQVIAASEVDHKVPKSQGGSDRDENLQALCKSCHSRKTMSELRR